MVLCEFRRDPQTSSVLQGQQPFAYHTKAAHVNASDGSCSFGKITFTAQGLDAGCGGHVEMNAAAGESLWF